MNTYEMHGALELASKGWPVFPLSGKVPAIAEKDGGHGCLDATTDMDQIEAWWTARPHANVGIATGKPARAFVLDVDPRHGGHVTLEALERKHGPLSLSVRAYTGSDGTHIYFAMPAGQDIGNSANRVGPGLDIRGTGGYIVAPPSIHPDTRRRYRWDEDAHPFEVGLLPAPEWLIKAALPPAPPPRPERPVIELSGTRAEKYALGALRNAVNKVASAPEGGRNMALNVGVWGLTRRFKDILGPQRIADAMAAAAIHAGLDQKETAATIASALRAGGVE